MLMRTKGSANYLNTEVSLRDTTALMNDGTIERLCMQVTSCAHTKTLTSGVCQKEAI
jgi:hypothetical protein